LDDFKDHVKNSIDMYGEYCLRQNEDTSPAIPVSNDGNPCGSPEYFGDGQCDDNNNNADCSYDGGDCCGDDKPDNWDQFCKDCQCIEGGECTIEPHPDCVFPFNYQGITYSECTSVDYDQPWCFVNETTGQWDICKCTGPPGHPNYCSEHSPCPENEGDCDYNTDCEGNLVCGTDNCGKDKGYEGWADCCTTASGTTTITPTTTPPTTDAPTLGETGFCSSDNPCSEYQGDCISQDDCKKGLKCANNNCPSFKGFPSWVNCCSGTGYECWCEKITIYHEEGFTDVYEIGNYTSSFGSYTKVSETYDGYSAYKQDEGDWEVLYYGYNLGWYIEKWVDGEFEMIVGYNIADSYCIHGSETWRYYDETIDGFIDAGKGLLIRCNDDDTTKPPTTTTPPITECKDKWSTKKCNKMKKKCKKSKVKKNCSKTCGETCAITECKDKWSMNKCNKNKKKCKKSKKVKKNCAKTCDDCK